MKRMTALNAAQRQLAENHIYIVRQVIRKQIEINENIFGFGHDDLLQEGCLWLCKAAATYDGSRAEFGAYAQAVVRNGLISYCRDMCRKQKKQTLLGAPLSSDDECNNDFLAVLAAEDSLDETLSIMDTLRLLESVKTGYRGVARLGIEAMELKVQGFTGADIAKMYGVPPNHVGAWISRAAQKLRQNERFMAQLCC